MEKILENVNFRACFRVIFYLVPTPPPPPPPLHYNGKGSIENWECCKHKH